MFAFNEGRLVLGLLELFLKTATDGVVICHLSTLPEQNRENARDSVSHDLLIRNEWMLVRFGN